MTLLLNMVVCAVALSAGGYPLPGLSYGNTTKSLTHRIGSQFEKLGKTVGMIGANNAKLPVNLPTEVVIPELPEREFPEVPNQVPKVVEEGVPHLPSKTGEDIAKILRDIPDAIDDPYDLEYLAILSEIDRKHSHYKLTHRDLQWKICAELLVTLDDNEDRVEFVTMVRRHPFHRRLPATVAITPKVHELWTAGRALFMKRIRDKGGKL